ncbi:MAG TPA: ABC transporter ATP-binding protein [Ktedonobacteraceae bacterium]|nr:ABC transporter ATP-binding protein [Ktedonobacteraceae bacterium]
MDNISPHHDDIIISTSRLTKVFGNLVAVNDLNLQVMRGDVFGFLGPNGSGKTTTIRMLLGLIRPTAGRAVIFGMDNTYRLSDILPRIGAIIEMPVFYPYLSGSDNLFAVAAASGMTSGKANRQRISEVLEIVELQQAAHRSYKNYSLGMKQRMGIAAALLTDPELILLDEPTNGLDPAGVYEIRQLIKRLASLGKTIFVSSHILYEVQQVCNRVAIMQKGNLIKIGQVSELLRQHEQIIVRMNGEDETRQALNYLTQIQEQGASWIKHIQVESNRQNIKQIQVDAPLSHSAEINALLAQQQLFAAELRPLEASLEEVFLEVTASANPNTEHPGMAALAREGNREEMPIPPSSAPNSIQGGR